MKLHLQSQKDVIMWSSIGSIIVTNAPNNTQEPTKVDAREVELHIGLQIIGYTTHHHHTCKSNKN